MMTSVVPEKNLNKQIGKQMRCMVGFLQIFDSHQLLFGKCVYSPKRLPPVETLSKSPLPLLVFECKEGSARSPWKFFNEALRLSLDNKAIVDAKGSLKPREIRTNASILSANQCEDKVHNYDKQ
ncbi:hypothetical protein GOBAR_AA17845 [Gossypium barbadense]|uniref:Uncharacterized protein n=1 Tax=Gossypium barbadense TaxID=3634 RepID=A0A2P5XHI5_GOSBA|nr:hypothetical protein GOBAR_AA17845 [Gossypium barbadense]